jgi:hypothetical protein
MIASMAIFFTIVIVGLTQSFPSAMVTSLTNICAIHLAPIMSNIPPAGALFSALLGSNPVTAMLSNLPTAVVATIPQSTLNRITGTTWFPTTFANAFIPALRTSFIIGAIFCIIAAILSSFRGDKYIHEYEVLKPYTETNIKQEESKVKIK